MTIEQQRDQWVRNEFVRCNNCEGDTSLDIRGAWDAGFLAGAQSGWVKVEDGLPELDVRVLAMVEGYTDMQVMVREWHNFDEENYGTIWCSCYGDINGDGNYDDDYVVTHWMPLPSKPII